MALFLIATTVPALPQAATPTFSPSAGTYSSTQLVTIACSTSSPTIYYTTNGLTPTTGSPIYTGPISVSASQTVKAIATASGFSQSTVASAAYVISGGVKLHFIFGAASNNYLKGGSGDSSVTSIKNEIDFALAGNTALIKGFQIIAQWPGIETALGVYDFSGFDAIRTYLVQNYPGTRVSILMYFAGFGVGSVTSIIPGYILSNPGVYGLSSDGSTGGWWNLTNGGTSPCAAWWRDAVANRIKAFAAALAVHPSPAAVNTYYGGTFTWDTDPGFEFIGWNESSISLQSGSDFNYTSNGVSHWNGIQQSWKQSFLTSSVIDQVNYWPGPNTPTSEKATVIQTDMNHGCVLSGVDTRPLYYGGYTDGQAWYVGLQRSDSNGTFAYGGATQYANCPFIAMNQGGWGAGYGSATQVTQWALNTLHACQFWPTIWNNASFAGDWNTQVLPALQAAGGIPGGSQICPANYIAQGGCIST